MNVKPAQTSVLNVHMIVLIVRLFVMTINAIVTMCKILLLKNVMLVPQHVTQMPVHLTLQKPISTIALPAKPDTLLITKGNACNVIVSAVFVLSMSLLPTPNHAQHVNLITL